MPIQSQYLRVMLFECDLSVGRVRKSPLAWSSLTSPASGAEDL